MDRRYLSVQLPAATASDTRLALAEVQDFAHTDMGRGDGSMWTFRRLSRGAADDELVRAAHAEQHAAGVDSVSFQPCSLYEYRSQDRRVVERWTLPGGGCWVFTAVLDGHVSHDTVDFVLQTLPGRTKHALEVLLHETLHPPPQRVSGVLAQTLHGIDAAITSGFLAAYSSRDGRSVVAPPPRTPQALASDVNIARMVSGTTALVTLYQEKTGDLWVANVGDCMAVLGTWTGTTWRGTLLNAVHNTHNAVERRRLQKEHPGEAGCVIHNRILGWLEPTRAIGDGWLKVPRTYAEKVFSQVNTPYFRGQDLQRYLPHLKTPPYVTSAPDVYYRRVRRPQQQTTPDGAVEAFLITATDGLLDGGRPDALEVTQAVIDRWAGVVGRELGTGRKPPRRNLALVLLRDAIGGDDLEVVSRNLTVEMDERWMDDITIVVQRFV